MKIHLVAKPRYICGLRQVDGRDIGVCKKPHIKGKTDPNDEGECFYDKVGFYLAQLLLFMNQIRYLMME